MTTESKKMTSIARKINAIYWFKRFSGIVALDFLIVLAVGVSYLYWKGYTYSTISSEAFTQMLEWARSYVFAPACVLGGAELLYLFCALFDISEVRVAMKPLNDLAVTAEKLSRIDLNKTPAPPTNYNEQRGFDTEKLSNLGQAIDRISPDDLREGIHTGDRDLRSIEVALNNLLLRMYENQKQQARFVSDASHELRTPIAVIQGYVNMLDRWGKEDEAVLKESIEALKNESDHMKTLVEQLLFLARGDSGRNTLHLVDFDLNEVMRDVYEESVMIDEKHVYVFEETPGVMVSGDIAMIKQSARIFIQNAAKYSNEGDTIKLKVTRTPDHKAVYSVQDEGIGMQESDVAHIFERFYRSDSARNSETGGTGLGLSIAKWIVDAHDGEIEVLSRVEFGTRISVKLQEKSV